MTLKAINTAIFLGNLLFLSCTAKPVAATPVENRKTFQKISDTLKIIPKKVDEQSVSRTLIIYYDAEIGKEYLMEAVKKYGAELLYEYKMLKGISIRIPEDKSVEQAITYFRKVKGVISVHRSQIYHIDPPIQQTL